MRLDYKEQHLEGSFHGRATPISVFETLSPIEEDLEQLHGILPTLIEAETETGREILSYLFAQPGKRIRPSLFLLTAKLVGYDGPHKLQVAAICEYIHTASLLHDDVVDNSMLRRGIATAYMIKATRWLPWPLFLLVGTCGGMVASHERRTSSSAIAAGAVRPSWGVLRSSWRPFDETRLPTRSSR